MKTKGVRRGRALGRWRGGVGRTGENQKEKERGEEEADEDEDENEGGG